MYGYQGGRLPTRLVCGLADVVVPVCWRFGRVCLGSAFEVGFGEVVAADEEEEDGDGGEAFGDDADFLLRGLVYVVSTGHVFFSIYSGFYGLCVRIIAVLV